MTATFSKYHGIGNEKLVEILADGPDPDATQELHDRSVTPEEIAEFVERVQNRRRS